MAFGTFPVKKTIARFNHLAQKSECSVPVWMVLPPTMILKPL
jgi:hypothetical protein